MKNKAGAPTKKAGDILQTFRDRIREDLGAVPQARSWYDIRNQDGDVAEIRIYDEISWWGISADQFASELEEITAAEILVMINSPGGDVFDGIAIYNALRAHPAKVTTRVDGIAASVASVIAQAGDHRIMLTGAQMMIHEAWGLAIGTADDMREYADLLERQNVNIAGIYARRAGNTAAHYRDLMSDDKWFDADETVAEGLADEVVDLPPNAETAKNVNTKTLKNELDETMVVVSSTIDSAERVAALRAEKGKSLSQINRDSLDELKQSIKRLSALVEDEEEIAVEEEQDTTSEAVDGSGDEIAAAINEEFLRFVASGV